MFNPFAIMLFWQKMALMTWCNLLHQQALLLDHDAHRRAEDKGRLCRSRRMGAGADQADHYGHRALDVDVERI